MSISASSVRELRTKTGAGMMDCKKALVETNGNFEEAVDWLRKGLSAAAKKAGRVAAEGLTASKLGDKYGVAIEINAETDFVSKNAEFQNLSKEVLSYATKCDSIKVLEEYKTDSGKSVKDLVVEKVATIGENLNLRRMKKIEVNNGVVASYTHNAVLEEGDSAMGRISVLVALESEADQEKLKDLAKKIAMHVAAARPEALTKEEVDPTLIEREKNIFAEQSKASGKPENIIEKMIDGRIRKYLEEIVLLDQTFVMDNKTKISDLIANASKELGHKVELKDYVRFELGDGIEKEEKNFADEVAEAAKK